MHLAECWLYCLRASVVAWPHTLPNYAQSHSSLKTASTGTPCYCIQVSQGRPVQVQWEPINWAGASHTSYESRAYLEDHHADAAGCDVYAQLLESI